MGKKILTGIAAALIATSVGATQTSCVHTRSGIVTAIEQRDAGVRRDLEQLLESVHCVRMVAEYRRDGATAEEPTKTVKGYGTAFAYAHRNGYTYLVTNAHVVDEPAKIRDVQVIPGPDGLALSVTNYTSVGEKLYLVKNRADTTIADDIVVEEVAKNTELDIAILRTRKRLPISDSYDMSQSFRPGVGSEVYLVGYPRGAFPAVTRGIIANPDHQFPDGDRLQVFSAEGTFGNSGSPYFVRQGGRLSWAGLMNSAFLHSTRTPMLGMGVPLHRFMDMLTDPEAYARSHPTTADEAGEE